MNEATKATVTQIRYAGLEFEGLMLPNGEYAVSVTQVARLLSFDTNQASRKFKSLLGKDFRFDTTKSELNSKAVNILKLEQLTESMIQHEEKDYLQTIHNIIRSKIDGNS